MMACDTGNTQLVITIAMAKLQSILPKLYQVRKNSSFFYLLNNYSNQFFSSFYKRIVRNLLVLQFYKRIVDSLLLLLSVCKTDSQKQTGKKSKVSRERLLYKQ
jgi:hypothetical protein